MSIYYCSVIGLIAAMWVVFVLLITRKAYMMPYQITLVLVVAQVTSFPLSEK